MKHKSVRTKALRDITDHLPPLPFGDVWEVRASHLDTKETSKLNRQLGVHRLNKQQK